jgi:hypothetical protein
MLVGIGSIFLFHFGLVHILIINKIGLVGAVGVAMWPAWQPLPSYASPLLQMDPTHHEPKSN